MQYSDFDEIKEIGSGSYTTVYTAKYRNSEAQHIPEMVVLKRFKHFDEAEDLLVNEVSNFDSIDKWVFNMKLTLYLFLFISSEFM